MPTLTPAQLVRALCTPPSVPVVLSVTELPQPTTPAEDQLHFAAVSRHRRYTDLPETASHAEREYARTLMIVTYLDYVRALETRPAHAAA